MRLSCLLYSSMLMGLSSCGGGLTVPPVQGVTVMPMTVTVKPGHTAQFTASVTASAGVDTTVTWSSLNTAVVTIDSTGLATGVTVGSADIVATAKADKTMSGAAQVTVATSITTRRANP